MLLRQDTAGRASSPPCLRFADIAWLGFIWRWHFSIFGFYMLEKDF